MKKSMIAKTAKEYSPYGSRLYRNFIVTIGGQKTECLIGTQTH